MIITNSIIKVKNSFDNKEDIKSYLYNHIENHPYRQYNQKIAKEFGEALFSMTFFPPDIVVLTQRYPNDDLYQKSLQSRNDIIKFMIDKNLIEYYKTSEPMEQIYD